LSRKQQLQRIGHEETGIGIVVAIMGFLLFIDFLAIDSEIFNTTAPLVIQNLSRYFDFGGFSIDLLMTGTILGIIAMFQLERKKNEL